MAIYRNSAHRRREALTSASLDLLHGCLGYRNDLEEDLCRPPLLFRTGTTSERSYVKTSVPQRPIRARSVPTDAQVVARRHYYSSSGRPLGISERREAGSEGE